MNHVATSPPPRRYYGDLFLTCFAGLLLEISYTRIFSFKLFYFFTYLVIGMALLGLGSSGVFVVVSKRTRQFPLDRLVALTSLLGAASIAGGYVLIARLPMDTFALAHSYAEGARLAVLCGTLFVPFFAIGLSISSILGRIPGAVNRLYFADLAGAALGCACAIPLISVLGPPSTALLSGAVLAVVGVREGLKWSWAVVGANAIVLLIATACAFLPAVLPSIVTDRKKPIHSGAPDTPQPLFSKWGPIFRVDVHDFPPITAWPFRLVFHDGLQGSTLQSFPGDFSALTHFIRTCAPFPSRWPSLTRKNSSSVRRVGMRSLPGFTLAPAILPASRLTP
ncbi:MAG: hypothetical protein FJY92_06055 [Candidatus Hydrogenedentes bacterium]|nr:hypothetical protein [Candidatus Hydrogenedentota bacterium]